ncbi:MAG TPA: hypothetical protein VMS32_08815 [Verrucomicrobiae bacterium]|nr:hypothetical protein [Verrucomicrobiae bacterium]
MKSFTFTLVLLVVAVVLGVNPACAATVRLFEGNLILARSGAQSTYLWDATKYVTQLVVDKDLGTQGMRDLQATAMQTLADKARNSKSESILLSVLYSKIGAISPVYGTATFAGVEKVLTLTASRIEIAKNGSRDAAMLLAGQTPPGIKVVVTGALPPIQ